MEVARRTASASSAIEDRAREEGPRPRAVGRERAVELVRIEKEKALEVERRAIQEVIRERVIVEKAVAEEEEKIKEVRAVEEAKRTRDAAILIAEGEAQEKLVKDIKSAEAAEQAAKFLAKEKILQADASLEAADREARAKIRLAEGLEAEAAAPGLAEARVKEADAIATEKLGLAQVRVRESEADAVEKMGFAEAKVLREKAAAEAAGIQEKADAMKKLDEKSREHEEFRLRIELEKLLGSEAIRVDESVAKAKAAILGEALRAAKIDIVGGDGAFLDRIVNSIGMGKAVDEVVGRSATLSNIVEKFRKGDGKIASAIADTLGELVDSVEKPGRNRPKSD
jgi:uncharacterized membrane protein YqiK